ncbi:MAG: hypothetical protein AAB355_02515 [Patescibacteria group bacterium]
MTEMPNGDNKPIDFSDALRGARSRPSFEEPRQTEIHSPIEDSPKMVQWVVMYSGGLVKTGTQANYVLVSFSALAIIVSLYIFFGTVSEQSIIIRPAVI